jgi:hypothetical protein
MDEGGRRMTLNQFRSFLYALGRLFGDLSAVRKGPDAVAKQLARRAAGRMTGGVLGKLFR